MFGNVDPVVFTIGDDESDNGGEYESAPSRMFSEQFYHSVAGSTKIWEETHDIMMANHCRLMLKYYEMKLDVGEKERRLEELRGRKKTLAGIRDQLTDAVRCMNKKVVQTYNATVSRKRVLREKQDLLQSLQEEKKKMNRRMEAEVVMFHRQLAIKLKVLYNIKH